MKESIFPEDIEFIENVKRRFYSHKKEQFLSDFLSPWDISLARFALDGYSLSFEEWGGYDGAFRKRLLAYRDNFNRNMLHISCYEFHPDEMIKYPSKGALLSALLSKGIKSENVGDIFSVSDSYIVFIDSEKMIPQLPDVEIKEVRGTPSECLRKIRDNVTGTVSSLRLDAILAIAYKPSRSKMQGLIENGGAMVNYRYTMKPAKELVAGDIVSLRGFPRFKLSESGDETKKGRIRVRLEFVD